MVYDQWFARRAEHDARGVLRARRPRPGQADPALSLLVAVHRARRSRLHRAVDRGDPSAPDPRVRTAGILIRPHPGEPAAVASLRRDGPRRTSSVWPRGGASPVDAGVEERLLRLDVSLGRRRRHQHQRPDRVRHRRPPGLLDPHAGVSSHAGRHAPLPPSDVGGWRAAAAGRRLRRARAADCRGVRRSGGHAATDRRVRQGIHAAVRPGRRGDAAHGRGDRAARRVTGAGSTRTPALRLSASGAALPDRRADGDRPPRHARVAKALSGS